MFKFSSQHVLHLSRWYFYPQQFLPAWEKFDCFTPVKVQTCFKKSLIFKTCDSECVLMTIGSTIDLVKKTDFDPVTKVCRKNTETCFFIIHIDISDGKKREHLNQNHSPRQFLFIHTAQLIVLNSQGQNFLCRHYLIRIINRAGGAQIDC